MFLQTIIIMSKRPSSLLEGKLESLEQLQQQYNESLVAYDNAMQMFKLNSGIYFQTPCASSRYRLVPGQTSQSCFNYIWKQQKCTTPAPTIMDPSKNVIELVNQAYQIATDPASRDLCYTKSTPLSAYNQSPIPNLDIYDVSYADVSGNIQTYLSYSSTNTKAQCALECSRNPLCAAFSHNADTKQCKQYGLSALMTSAQLDANSKTTLSIAQPFSDLVKARVLHQKMQEINRAIQLELHEYRNGTWKKEYPEIARIEQAFSTVEEQLANEQKELDVLEASYQDSLRDTQQKETDISRNRLQYFLIFGIVVLCAIGLTYFVFAYNYSGTSTILQPITPSAASLSVTST